MTTAFTPNFSRLALTAAFLGCVEHVPIEHETTSLRVMVTSPTVLGSAADPLPDSTKTVTIAVQALDQAGHIDQLFTAPVQVYLHSLGVLSTKPVTVSLANGTGTGTIPLPLLYGETYLWVEDGLAQADHPASFATGTSPPLWFRGVFLDDVSHPDETKASALSVSPLEGKQVRILGSKFGANGRIVVTAVYSSGYTASDVDCTTLPCVAAPYGHIFAYSSSRPRDTSGNDLQVGHTLASLGGGIQEFNGFTEMNFPDQKIADPNPRSTPSETYLPEPVVITGAMLNDNSMEQKLRMESNESGLVALVDATVCALDSDYTRYSQWKVDVGAGCATPVNVISAGQVNGFDPAMYVGKRLRRIVGTLKGVNLSSRNIWIVQPRRSSDITTN